MSFKIISLTIYGENGYILAGNCSRLPRWNSPRSSREKHGVISLCGDKKETDIIYRIKNILFGSVLEVEEGNFDTENLGLEVYNYLLLNLNKLIKRLFTEKLQYIPLTGILHPLPKEDIINTIIGVFPISIWNNEENKNSENILNILKNFIEIINKKIVLGNSSNEKSI